MSKWTLGVLCCWISSVAMGQGSISGIIKDSVSVPLPYAGLILTPAAPQPARYGYSDQAGRFLFHDLAPGTYSLEVSCLGYASRQMEVEVTGRQEVILVLKRKSVALNEVIILPQRPISVSKDTVAILTDYFTNGTEQNVEDLLKKIPGLRIEEDGTIMVGQQEVEKVMVEGDDFFEKGYKLLTKNMAAYPVNKVEIYRNYSRNKHLKGIENSNKVALNLSLRDEIKRMWFGNGEAGYGGGRYQLKGNLMNFGKKSKYYLLTHHNTIGQEVMGDPEELANSSGVEDTDEEKQLIPPLSSVNIGSPDLKKQRVTFNHARLLSLNGIFKVSDKVKLKALGLIHADRNTFYRSSLYTVHSGTVSFTNSEVFEGNVTQLTGFGSVELTYDPTPVSTLRYTGKVNRGKAHNSTELKFNGVPLHEKLHETMFRQDHIVQFTQKISKHRALLYTGNYFQVKTPQEYSLYPFRYSDLPFQSEDSVKQMARYNREIWAGEVRLMQNSESEDLLEVWGGAKRLKENLDSRHGMGDGQNSILSFDVYLSGKYLKKVKQLQFLAQGELHGLYNRLSDKAIRLYMVPKVGVTYLPGKQHKIQSSYTYGISQPGVMDLHRQYIHTGFRTFSRGVPEFDLLNTSSALLNYSMGNWGGRFFLNTFLVYTRNHRSLSTATRLSPHYSLTEKIWIRGRESISAYASADRFFSGSKSNFKIAMSGRSADFQNRVNGSDLRSVNMLNGKIGWENRSAFLFFLNYHIGSRWSHHRVRSEAATAFTDRMSFADLDCKVSKRFHVKIQSERYYFSRLNKAYFFLDLEARYALRKDKLVFRIAGNNLLNTKNFQNYAVSDIGTSNTEYRLQPRLLMLKVECRF